MQCSAKTPGQPAATGSAGHDVDGVSIAVQPAANKVLSGVSGNKHSYGTWPFIVDFPIENGDFL